MTRHNPPPLNPHPHHALAQARAEQSRLRRNRYVELATFAIAAALFYWCLDLLTR